MGIEGNEQADMLARSALASLTVDIMLNLEFGETKTAYREHFLKKWQEQWDNSITGASYRDIEHQVDLSVKYKNKNRWKAAVISRLHFGHCLLNEQLYRWNRHGNATPVKCQKPSTLS